MQWRLIPAFGILALVSTSVGQPVASIHATVMNERDEAVRDAQVTAQPDGPLAMALPWCKSDENGTCTINVGSFGNYSVFASKTEDAYPEQHFSFFAAQNPKPPTVALSAEQPFQSVIVRLGKKAGILIGTVTDASTGKPIDATVEFHWVSDSRIFLRGSGLTNARFRVLVPSDTPVTMVVSLEGYEDWAYSLGRGEMRNAILLKPGEELSLDIRLRPKI